MTKSQVQKNNANLLSERPRLKHEWNHAVGWLNNLRYGIAAHRGCPLSLCATGGSGCLRDAGFVPAFANSGADDGQVSSQSSCRRRLARTEQKSSCAVSSPV